jgi:hypothetical protein
MTPLAFEEQRSTRSARVAPTRATRAAETLAPLAHTPLPPLSRHHPRTSPNAREGPMKVVARPFSPSVEALQWAPSGARWTAFGGGSRSRAPLPYLEARMVSGRACVEGWRCTSLWPGAASGDGGLVWRSTVAANFGPRAVLASALAASEASVGAGGVGGGRAALVVGGRPLLATAGLGWPRPAAVAGGFLVLSSSLLVWRCRGGGVRGLAGACWWRRGGAFSCVESRPVEVLRRCRGAANCLGCVHAAIMVRNRAKASTNVFVGWHDGSTFGHRSPRWGHHGEALCSQSRGALR